MKLRIFWANLKYLSSVRVESAVRATRKHIALVEEKIDG
jgi:hypothetical protein